MRLTEVEATPDFLMQCTVEISETLLAKLRDHCRRHDVDADHVITSALEQEDTISV